MDRHVKKYRKKPVVVDAIQWTGENAFNIGEFMSSQDIEFRKPYTSKRLTIYTLEGNMTASLNDWIIKGVQGEFYPCKPDIFKETYEEVI